jgi:hypothetical protein
MICGWDKHEADRNDKVLLFHQPDWTPQRPAGGTSTPLNGVQNTIFCFRDPRCSQMMPDGTSRSAGVKPVIYRFGPTCDSFWRNV